MFLWQSIFWASISIVFYNYAGYPLLVFLLNKIRNRKQPPARRSGTLPSVSFIVAAYNEEDFIEQKILNSLDQDYPEELIEFLFITDGSTDRTMEIILHYPKIKLLHVAGRGGKSAALNRAVGMATNDILIFSDANTILNKRAVRNITRHYNNKKVGGVAGEKKVMSSSGQGEDVGAGEGLYWKYESFLKQLDSDFYSVVGAAGELFSLRRSLYTPVAQSVILDDFIISMEVARRGYRIVYEPQAYAMELPSFSIGDEQKRKIRIAAGGFQAMQMLGLRSFLSQPRLLFLYISHRILRWTLSPLCLIFAFLVNLVLVLTTDILLYKAIFAAQAVFYTMALVAGMLELESKAFKLFKLCYYFVFMNVSVIQGFFRFIRGSQSAVWEKARRSVANAPTKSNA